MVRIEVLCYFCWLNFSISDAAEDNPLFDYPDELSEDEDDGSNDEDPFGDMEGSGSEYEKEEVEVEGDEQWWYEIVGGSPKGAVVNVTMQGVG